MGRKRVEITITRAVEDRWCREFESACRRLKRSRADLSRIGFISKLAKDGY